jgi:hypothetical protein
MIFSRGEILLLVARKSSARFNDLDLHLKHPVMVAMGLTEDLKVATAGEMDMLGPATCRT